MPEDSIGMNAGCFVRIFGHSVFVLGRRSCRRAFRHVCVEFRFSPLREPCPPAHSIRVVAQPNIHRGFSVARFRYDLPARRLREPRARFDGVLSSPSHCHHLRCLYARHRSPFGGASAGGIAAEQPPSPSRALAGYRRRPLLHRGPGDDGLYVNIPFPGQHPLLESLVNHRPVCVFLSFIGSIRRAVNRLVHARSVPFVARDQAAPDMPCGLPCCRGGILDLIRQRGFSEPLGRRFPQPFDGTRDAGHCGRRRDWHGNRAAHYARNLLDYSKGMPCHTCLGLHLLAWRIMLALLPHYMRSPLTEA